MSLTPIPARLKTKYTEYILLFFLSFFFLLFASTWTSPYYQYCLGDDASFYSMVGRGILKGYVPYKSFFDLKGPYLFFIQAIGQFLCEGKLGIFLIQIPFGYASVLLTYQIARLFLSRKRSLAVLLMFLFIYTATLWGGNTAEEFALPLTLLCLCLCLRFIQERELAAVPGYALIFGLCAGIMIFMKITLMSSIIAMTLTALILLLRERSYEALFQYILSFLFGLMLAALPVIFYFGYHNALKDLIYQEFIFGFKRGTDFGERFNVRWELKMSVLLTTLLFALLHKKIKGEYRLLVILMSVFVYLFLHLGTPFIYYFTSLLPVFVLSASLFLKVYDPFIITLKPAFALTLLSFFLFIGFYSGEVVTRIGDCIDAKNNPYYQEYYQKTKEMGELIPAAEKNSVFCLDPSCTWFEITKILPAYKYQINLPFFIALDPQIENDLLYYFSFTPSKWMVTENLEDLDLSEALKETVRSRYELVSFNDYHELYRLRDLPAAPQIAYPARKPSNE